MAKQILIISVIIVSALASLGGWAMAQETDTRPWLGIQIETVEAGVQVMAVMPDSPAAAAGLQAEDVITALGETSVTDAEGLIAELGNFAPDDEVTLSVLRGEETLEIAVTLGTQPEDVTIEVAPMNGMGMMNEGRVGLGVHYHPIDETFATNLGLSVTSGALVLDVMPESPAAKADVQAGDLITAVDGLAVDAEHTLADLISDYEAEDVITLTVLRAGQESSVEVTLEAGLFFHMGDMMPNGRQGFHFGGQGMPDMDGRGFNFFGGQGMPDMNGQGFNFGFGGQGMPDMNGRGFNFEFDGENMPFGNGRGFQAIPFDLGELDELIPEGMDSATITCTDEDGNEVFSFSFEGGFHGNMERGQGRGQGLDLQNLNCEITEGAQTPSDGNDL